MALNTEVCNLALSHLGVTKTITDAESEQTVEAKQCRRFYERALQVCLRDYPWPFATRFAKLALVENNPISHWAFSYRYPANCLHMRKILGDSRNDTREERIAYQITSDDSGKLVYTDRPDAEIEYTINLTDYTVMTPDFIMAFSFLLAHYLAPSLTSGDPFKLGERAEQNYLKEISSSKSAAINEAQVDELPESAFVRGRS